MVLCDTNGGTLPDEIERIVSEVFEHIPGERVGIHCHNDTENAVANSLAAVRASARQVQGTINGLGERCGSNLLRNPEPDAEDGGGDRRDGGGLQGLTRLSRLLDERLNHASNPAAYVGASAFARKGGLHVSLCRRTRRPTNVAPNAVGNRRQILVSDQAGRSNVLARFREIGLEIDEKHPKIQRLVEVVKEREFQGWAYDSAEASFELLARRMLEDVPAYFEIDRFRVMDERRFNAKGTLVVESEATATISVGERRLHEVAVGNGLVNALDTAIRKALVEAYPIVETVRLVDYKVRILPPPDGGDGTDAVTRVMIENADTDGHVWRTVGVSPNIIDASMSALADGLVYKMVRDKVTALG